jgi:hypothetical protein
MLVGPSAFHETSYASRAAAQPRQLARALQSLWRKEEPAVR